MFSLEIQLLDKTWENKNTESFFPFLSFILTFSYLLFLLSLEDGGSQCFKHPFGEAIQACTGTYGGRYPSHGFAVFQRQQS